MSQARGVRADAVRNRAKILEAARSLIAEHGDTAQMSDISAAAGVAVGTLYRHFPTKHDLVAAVIDEYIEQVHGEAQAAVQRVRTGARPLDELSAFLTGTVDATARIQAVKTVAAAGESRTPTPVEAEVASTVAELLALAHDHGDLRADVTVADLYLLVTAAPADMTPEQRDRWVSIVVFGLAARSEGVN